MFKSLKKFVVEVLATLVVENIAVFLLSSIIAILSNRGFEMFVSYEVSICYALIIFVAVYTVSTMCFLQPHKFRFRISSLDINVEYLGDEVIVREKFVVRTNRLSAEKMYTRREWFSNEEFSLVAVSDGFKVVPTEIIGQTHHFYIQFPEKKYFWEKIEFSLEFRGTNKKRQFKNFYWYDVICPTKNLRIEVRMAQDFCGKYAFLKSFLGHEQAAGKKLNKINYDGCYCWDVLPRPKLWWSYKFEWRWSKKELKKINKSNVR